MTTDKRKSPKTETPVKATKPAKPKVTKTVKFAESDTEDLTTSMKSMKIQKPSKIIIKKEEIIDNRDEELFFNKNSFNAFIEKNSIQALDPSSYVNNDLHHIDIVVPKNQRETDSKMTSFEYARVLSERSKQIENGSPIFVDIGNETDILKIAKMEIDQKRCPMVITRMITPNIVEKWEVNEMTLPKR